MNTRNEATTENVKSPTVAFLSRGRLFVKRPDGPVEEIESDFARNAMKREEKLQSQNAWKQRGSAWDSMSMGGPQFSDWEQQGKPRVGFRISNIAAGADNSIFYSLDMHGVGGLFLYDLQKKREARLMHREGFATRGLSWDPTEEAFALSIPKENGTFGIAIGRSEGRRIGHVSGGDSVDVSPCWDRKDPAHVVYQSAPIGRDQHGQYLGMGSFGLEQLNISSGDVTPILNDDSIDYLAPRRNGSAELYYIRRPYKPQHERSVSFLDTVKDVVYMPFRILRTIFFFFNFMSVMFSGKPLSTSAGPKRDTHESQMLTVWGHMLDAKGAIEKSKNTDDSASLAPADWTLVKRCGAGTETEIARFVLAYDICDDGSVVYSNGSSVFHVQDGRETKLCSEPLIEQVVAIPVAPDGDEDSPSR